MKEPLGHLSRKELQLNILKNIESAIDNEFWMDNPDSDYTEDFIRLKHWWHNTPNWGKVQMFINGGTSKAGSTSSTEQCIFLGINPDNTSIKECE